MQTINEAMSSVGIIPKKSTIFTTNNKITRFSVNGDSQGSLNGWVWLSSDGQGVEFGAFGSWKTGETHTFCSRADSELDQDQLKRKREAIAEAQKQRDAEIKQMQGQAAKRANEMLNACDNSITQHPYLDRKQIHKHSAMIGEFVRYGDDGAIWARHENALLIPMINDAGKIVNVQAIFEDGSKMFSRGGRKKGCYHVISGRNANAPIFVCEGFATGATINEATDCTVVIAFDAGNLMPVAESVKKLYTGRKVVIAADNDQWGETNAGISKAEQASKNLSIPFIAPVFDDTTSKPTDFNDLAILQGHAEVARQLLTETPKIEAPQVAGVIDHLAHIAVETYEMQVNSKGKPLATIENFASIVKQLGVSIRYNEMSKEVEVKIPNLVSTTDNVTGVARAHLVSALNRVGFPIASLDEYILTLADANTYNPVCEWIESRPWDGVERITQLMKTVKLKSDSKLENGGSLSHLLMLRWMIGTVAAQYEPRGIMMKGVLVFVGAQSIGKTTWLKRLMPESLFSVKDGLILDPANKDSVKSAISHAIVELGEIDATFKRTDIAHLKAFITQDRDRIRLPYARTESNFPRRTVFFGSVNESNYLNDKTGNSRFWTIDVDTIDYMHGLDMQQVWAEVKERFYTPNCQAWHLTETELQALNARNASHEAIEPIHELITSSFNWGQIESTRKKMMNSTEICQAIGIQQPKKSDTGIASAYLRSLGVSKENGGAKRFYMPDRV